MLWSKIDVNGDGSVELDEWLTFMQKLELALRRAVAACSSDPAEAFNVMDVDGNGTLDIEELQVQRHLGLHAVVTRLQ